MYQKKKNIKFMWVPSYIGSTGNEMYDNIADFPTRTISHPTITDIPVNNIKLSIKQKINMLWQKY